MAETSSIRPGEQIDTPSLAEYLSAHLSPALNEIDIEQFPAGSSNLTYLITIDGSEFVLRRPPFGNTVKSAHDMRREFDVLSKLSQVYPPAPRPLLFCDDTAVIGAEFYLMERRRGLIIRGRAPEELETSSDLQRETCAAFIENLAQLHSLDLKQSGLDDLGHPEGYCKRQVEGWTARYFKAKTDELPALESAILWLNENIPLESRASLIHNDYKFDNVMLDPKDLRKITAVLDWEMVTVGDPLMDLGTTLGYWMSADSGDEMLSMPFNPRVLMENISRGELVEMYEKASASSLGDIHYYYVFGTFKIAVIAQQIYARFVRGATQDRRFAHFDRFVSALGLTASQAIKRGHI